MANRNEKKKTTFVDLWTRFYTKGAARRQKRSDKKFASKKQREVDKNVIRENLKDR